MIAHADTPADYSRQKRYQQRQRSHKLRSGNFQVIHKEHDSKREPGTRSIVIAVVEQAVMDYFWLRRAGIVRYRQLQRPPEPSSFVTVEDVEALLAFFRDGYCQRMLDMVDCTSFSERGIWEGLLRMEKNGHWSGCALNEDTETANTKP